jgi:hypothetical protein
MDFNEFRASHPYQVLVHDMTRDEIYDLRSHLVTDAYIFHEEVIPPARRPGYLTRKLQLQLWQYRRFELDRLYDFVVFPFAKGANDMRGMVTHGHGQGVVEKSELDVLVDRMKKWLETQSRDREVDVYSGPDDVVVRIVKTGKEIRTEKGPMPD